jgi:hypothetical protein
MSELKVYHHELRHNEYEEFYLKYEADKVISELEDDVTYWKEVAKKNMDDNVTMAKQRSEAFKRERHHKYKRCLAMAMWCDSENYTACWYHENSERCEWTEKWNERWLELAEQFKEAK